MLKKLGFHVDLAEFCNTATKLKERLYSIQNAHMCKANFFDEFQFRVFRKCRDCFGYSEHGTDDIMG